jgi:hypothetical protein
MPTWLIGVLIQVVTPLIQPILVQLSAKLGTILAAYVSTLATEEKSSNQLKTTGIVMTSADKLSTATAMVNNIVDGAKSADVDAAIHAALAQTQGAGATGTLTFQSSPIPYDVKSTGG